LEASINGAKGVLMNITGSSNMGLFEVNEAAEIVSEAADPDALVIFGAVIDDSMGDELKVTVIATGFDVQQAEQPLKARTDRVQIKPLAGSDDLDIPPFLRRAR
jgi:cell division protein FtsZ